MNIHTVLSIGQHHINNCEDYLIVSEIGEHRLLCAVMDGCSMGIDSHFASTLTGKLLRKIAKEHSYKEFISKNTTSLPHLLENILCQLFLQLHQQKNLLQLEREEVLSTLLIAVIDTKTRSGEFLCVGDGLVCINQQLFEFEQDNKPDYLGYHLNEDFTAWYNKQQQRISTNNIIDFSIATDGIFTFSKFNNLLYQTSGDAIEFLLMNKNESANLLQYKLIEIEKEWGLKPTDDLAIVRVLF